ncbi:MAG: hypothetical protein RID53_16325 [Coleofasciculus sp. B1-GNL1-01]|uniref:hypothetical protein n=1 Tax=Coleofasciculus sp. B1-GNL1-01 TaxID=3068484 RepID=UPI0032F79179
MTKKLLSLLLVLALGVSVGACQNAGVEEPVEGEEAVEEPVEGEAVEGEEAEEAEEAE